MLLYYCKLNLNDNNIIEYGVIEQLYKPTSKSTILKYGHIDNWCKSVMPTDIEPLYIIFDIDFKFDENPPYKEKINILYDLKSKIRQSKLELLSK